MVIQKIWDAMIQFLLSDSATYITGQDFAVDGGALGFGFCDGGKNERDRTF